MQFYKIANVLDRERVGRVRARLEGLAFVDGMVTGATVGPQVKFNQQIKARREDLVPLVEDVQGALVAREEFTGVAFPRRMHLNFNRYEEGMHYGDHNDAAVVGTGMAAAVRTDLSFTLFLTDPDEYDGGDLVIRTGLGDTRVKLPAGDAVLYEGSSVHCVEPVRSGVRLAAFGWIQSLVRDPRQRETLAQLRRVRRGLTEERPDSPHLDELGNAYNNIMRMWTDG